jgi:hypothetical protein
MGTTTGAPLEVETSSQLSEKEGGLSQSGLEMSLSDSAPLSASFQDAAVGQSQLRLPGSGAQRRGGSHSWHIREYMILR